MQIRKSICQIWERQTKTELKRNTNLLIIAQLFNAGCTFGFWLICAHTLTTTEVGLASAFITLGTFMATFANLGLASTIIRHLNNHRAKSNLALTCLLIAAPISFFAGLIGLGLVSLINSKLNFITDSIFLTAAMIVFVIASVVLVLLEAIAISLGKAELILLRTVVTNVIKLGVPVLAIGLGLNGAVSAYTVATVLGLVCLLFWIKKILPITRQSKPKISLIWKERHFAFGNYAGLLVGTLPSTVVPLIVLDKLGAEAAAYFYIPLQIALFLNVLSSSTSQALFSAASKSDKDPDQQLTSLAQAITHLFKMILLAVTGVLILDWPILSLYGADYAANGYLLIGLFAMASFFVAINWLGDTWLNIQKRTRLYFTMNALNSILVVGLVYLMSNHGLVAVGQGWLIAQALTAVVFLILLRGDLARLITAQSKSA